MEERYVAAVKATRWTLENNLNNRSLDSILYTVARNYKLNEDQKQNLRIEFGVE